MIIIQIEALDKRVDPISGSCLSYGQIFITDIRMIVKKEGSVSDSITFCKALAPKSHCYFSWDIMIDRILRHFHNIQSHEFIVKHGQNSHLQ